MMYGERKRTFIIIKIHYYITYYNFRFGKLISKYSIIDQVKDRSLINLCEAYEVLSDPLRRAMYDQFDEVRIKRGINSEKIKINPWTYHANPIKTYS